jgi:hypothetical protein
LLLVAALCLGIGYAAVTDELTISGSASLDGSELVKEFDGEVYFESLTGNTGLAAGSAIDTSDNDKAIFSVEGLTKIDEEVSVTYTIKNDYEKEVWVSVKGTPTNASNEFIEITNVIADAHIPSQGTTTVTVTAKVIGTSNKLETLSGYELTLEVTDENPNP